MRPLLEYCDAREPRGIHERRLVSREGIEPSSRRLRERVVGGRERPQSSNRSAIQALCVRSVSRWEIVRNLDGSHCDRADTSAALDYDPTTSWSRIIGDSDRGTSSRASRARRCSVSQSLVCSPGEASRSNARSLNQRFASSKRSDANSPVLNPSFARTLVEGLCGAPLQPSRCLRLAFEDTGFDLERLGITPAELERYGAVLVFDEASQNGDRLLVWTQ